MAIKGLTSLEILDLTYNQLGHLDNSPFGGLTSLNELYLTGNQFAQKGNISFE